ncbi:uncharacterized [Tachysurus ichikawai]
MLGSKKGSYMEVSGAAMAACWFLQFSAYHEPRLAERPPGAPVTIPRPFSRAL